MDAHQTFICCFGNPIHGDDGVGLAVYETLKRQGLTSVGFYGDVPLNALDAFEVSQHIIIVDALVKPEQEGCVQVLNVEDLSESDHAMQASNHFNSIPYLIKAAQHSLPVMPSLDIFTVAIKPVQSYQQGLSPKVSQGVSDLCDQLVGINKTSLVG